MSIRKRPCNTATTPVLPEGGIWMETDCTLFRRLWLNTSGKRRCSLKRCMHCTHGCHEIESVSFSSLLPLPPATPRPSHLATSLAPGHVPRTSPPHSPNAPSNFQLHPSPRVQNPSPCPPLPPSPSPRITVRPRRRRMLQPETQPSCSQSCRTSTWPEAATGEES